ncbi:hypothetical protein COCOBI_17-2630 [Coccomyxa sp. Obi]|nr:hypothetical protein COCOBI_17-2630 [Coccomyxa sp. Obi]
MKRRKDIRQSSAHHETQVLPPEIWRVIAGHLGPRKWARVAGICKATWHLQLDPVHLVQCFYEWYPTGRVSNERYEESLTWLLKRASSAQKLEVVFPTFNQQATARAILESPNDFRKLTGLDIHATRTGIPEDAEHVMMAVAWLLGQTRELKYLHVAFDGMPYLPRFSHIRHLQISCLDCNICRMLPIIASLGTLQTLELTRSRFSEIDPPQIIPDLQALPQLQSVVLCDLVPSSLMLAKGTALHVTVFSLRDAQSIIWDSASKAIKSFKLLSDKEEITSDAEISQWLLRPCDLDTLVFKLKSFGEQYIGAIRLKGAFLSTKRLGFDCVSSLYVEVPSESYQWELVNFHTDGQLHVLLDSSFPLRCPVFSFSFNHLGGVDIMEIACCMRQSGMPFRLEQYPEYASRFHTPCNNLDVLDLLSDCHNNRSASSCFAMASATNCSLPLLVRT